MYFIQSFNTQQAWSDSRTQHVSCIQRNPYKLNMNIPFSNLNFNLKIKQSFWNGLKTCVAQIWPKTVISKKNFAVALIQHNTILQVHTHTHAALTVLLGPAELWTLHLQCRKSDYSPAAWERIKNREKIFEDDDVGSSVWCSIIMVIE